MDTLGVNSVIEKAERLLAAEELSERTELAIQELLNVVELSETTLKLLLDGCLGQRNKQVRTASEVSARGTFLQRCCKHRRSQASLPSPISATA